MQDPCHEHVTPEKPSFPSKVPSEKYIQAYCQPEIAGKDQLIMSSVRVVELLSQLSSGASSRKLKKIELNQGVELGGEISKCSDFSKHFYVRAGAKIATVRGFELIFDSLNPVIEEEYLDDGMKNMQVARDRREYLRHFESIRQRMIAPRVTPAIPEVPAQDLQARILQLEDELTAAYSKMVVSDRKLVEKADEATFIYGYTHNYLGLEHRPDVAPKKADAPDIALKRQALGAAKPTSAPPVAAKPTIAKPAPAAKPAAAECCVRTKKTTPVAAPPVQP